MPAPRMPECREHREAYKNSDGNYNDCVPTEAKRICEYLLDSAHDSTGLRLLALTSTGLVCCLGIVPEKLLSAAFKPRDLAYARLVQGKTQCRGQNSQPVFHAAPEAD